MDRWNMNLSLIKKFTHIERKKIEVRRRAPLAEKAEEEEILSRVSNPNIK